MTDKDVLEALSERVSIFSSEDDRALVMDEARRDPSFGRTLLSTLLRPGGERKVANSAKQAILNELDPALYPETQGLWAGLREAIGSVVRSLESTIRHIVSSMTIEEKDRALRNLKERHHFGLGDLGQFEIIGSLVESLAKAGASIYSSTLQSNTQQQIARMQLNAQMQQIQAQQSMTSAQQAMDQAQLGTAGAAIKSGVMDITNTLSQPVMGGIPLWMILVGIFLFAEKA